MVPRQDGTSFTHRLLPSGTQNSTARLVLGPGAVIDVETLQAEIAACNVEHGRLTIDPQVMVISRADINAEKRLVGAIGSTGKGVGWATARRIRDRGRKVKLARDVPDLAPYIWPTQDILEDAYAHGLRIMLEGTQGTMLSLYHGEYPHVTSRDTTVAGCLAEAGIPPSRIRRVVMVCRTYPIRVQSPDGSTSGYMSQEITWEELAKRSGIDVEELRDVREGLRIQEAAPSCGVRLGAPSQGGPPQRPDGYCPDLRRPPQREEPRRPSARSAHDGHDSFHRRGRARCRRQRVAHLDQVSSTIDHRPPPLVAAWTLTTS
jgi:adenylosuccinate synthetase